MIEQFKFQDNVGNLEVHEAFKKSISFINSIGIPTQYKKLEKDSFLPGLFIEAGTIFIDVDALKYPGDILHEAGHLAVIPGADRRKTGAEAFAFRPDREAEEMMAIAWSYAACQHLGLPLSFVFHDDGYKGGGSNIGENFKNKNYFGLPMLQWLGMTYDEQNAASHGAAPYPSMIKWLRD